jgi:hypothetical protein
MRDILDVILGDDDLRRGFRQSCGVKVPVLKRLHRRLDQVVVRELDAIGNPPR